MDIKVVTIYRCILSLILLTGIPLLTPVYSLDMNSGSGKVMADIRIGFMNRDTGAFEQYVPRDGKIYFSLPVLNIEGNYFSRSHLLSLFKEIVFRDIQTLSFVISEDLPQPQLVSPGPMIHKAVWNFTLVKEKKNYRAEILFHIEERKNAYLITRMNTIFTGPQ